MGLFHTGGNISNVSVSAETAGTGSSQNVAHGLGTTPKGVYVLLSEIATGENPNIAMGSHTATNVVLTVASASVKFFVIAWA